jgi:hypothetical protein
MARSLCFRWFVIDPSAPDHRCESLSPFVLVDPVSVDKETVWEPPKPGQRHRHRAGGFGSIPCRIGAEKLALVVAVMLVPEQ